MIRELTAVLVVGWTEHAIPTLTRNIDGTVDVHDDTTGNHIAHFSNYSAAAQYCALLCDGKG
jgi:hypothetical protein